jgi:hypothetical protein
MSEGKTVYVVLASGLNYDLPEVWGVYSTQVRAKRECKHANEAHGRTKGTSGSFRVFPRNLDQA